MRPFFASTESQESKSEVAVRNKTRQCAQGPILRPNLYLCLGSNLGSIPPPFLPKFPITQCPLSPPIPTKNPNPSTPQTPQTINPSLLRSILSNYVDLVTIVSSTSFYIDHCDQWLNTNIVTLDDTGTSRVMLKL